ncbi:MAG: hypothetical protein ACTTJ7_01945 [Treponema sp.]
MVATLFFCFPLLFITQIASRKNHAGHFLAYGIGLIEGSLLLAAFSWFGIVFDRSIASFTSYWFIYTFIHILIPSLFGIILYFLLACLSSAKAILWCPSVLFGLFTAQLYSFILTYSSSIHMLPIILHIVIYTSAVFLFDALLGLINGIPGFRIAVGLTSGLFVFCLTVAAGFYAYTLWHFNTHRILYYAIFIVISFSALIVHALCRKSV